MTGRGKTRDYQARLALARPVAFWVGLGGCVVGVCLHLPMYVMARDHGYRLAGMAPDPAMIAGMASIVVGLMLSLWGLVPRSFAAPRSVSPAVVHALDDAPLNGRHIALILAMSTAVTIDFMKTTTLSFIAPGVAAEYGLRSAANPHASVPVSLLPLCGIVGTVIGSLVWGWLGDRIGRRASILYAGILFIATSVCGTMPNFEWNLAMCLLMGVGAGGMLPIAFALISEAIPPRHRSWLLVLIGGDVAGAYLVTSWLSGLITPGYGWRAMWLVGLPTGIVLIALTRWIPESPRFLIATGRLREAGVALGQLGARAHRTSEGAPDEATDRRFAGPTMSRQPLRKATIGVTSLAFSVGVLTYGFQFWIPTNLQHMGLSAVTADFALRDAALLGLPLTVLIAALYSRVSSRGTIVGLSLVTGISACVFAASSSLIANRPALLSLFLTIPLAGISSVVGVVIAYASELYPTAVRSRGTGLVAGMSKVGGVAVLGYAVAGAASPDMVTTAILGGVPLIASAALFARVAPETGRRRLEEIHDVGHPVEIA